MLNEELQAVIEKYQIEKTTNIIYGTNIPMPKVIIPTPWGTYMKMEKSQFYFFYFDEEGISIYPIDGGNYAKIQWNEIEKLKISKFLMIGKMTIRTKEHTLKFQINRYVIGCPWIRENTKYLEKHQYFYKADRS